MSNSPPWQARLARARREGGASAAPVPAPREVPQASSGLVASLAPELAGLLAEREALEARMASLTGGQQSADARYAVAPFAERRAEHRRWASAREALRERRRTLAAPPERPAEAAAPAEPRPRRRPAPDRPHDPVESIGTTLRDVTTADPLARFATALDRAETRMAELLAGDSPLRDRLLAGRDLTTADPLARFATAIDRAEARMAALLAGNTPFRGRLLAAWREQAQSRIPGLGAADPYVREATRKLAVVTGSVAEIGERTAELREVARDVRELREADAARDEARRDRALARLRERRTDVD